LRTPLAVIRGAIEVMLDSGCDAASALRLKRMQRGADELRDLLDALLVLARSDASGSERARTDDLDALVGGLLRERADALREKRVLVEHAGVPGIVVSAPPRVLSVVIGNLLRAVTQFAEGGTLRVNVAPEGVGIERHVAAAASARGDDHAERVLGLSMIRRVCERWNWALEEKSDGDASPGFVLHLSKPPSLLLDLTGAE